MGAPARYACVCVWLGSHVFAREREPCLCVETPVGYDVVELCLCVEVDAGGDVQGGVNGEESGSAGASRGARQAGVSRGMPWWESLMRGRFQPAPRERLDRIGCLERERDDMVVWRVAHVGA